MKYSHQLTYSLFVDSIEEASFTFYGASLEMQELELVLTRILPPSNVYYQQVLEFIDNMASAYTGKLEYIIEISYNERLKEPKLTLEENHELS